MPILWLSLFDTGGLVTWPGIYDGSPYTAVIQPAGECVERSRIRLEDRSRRWHEVFTGISRLWLGYVGAVREAYLAVWTEQLAGLAGGDERWAADLRPHLSGLDDPESAEFRRALDPSYIHPTEGRLEPFDTVGLVAAGYTWEGAGHGPFWQGPRPGDDHSGCPMCTGRGT